MDKHRAPSPDHARPRVVVQFDNQIIELIGAPKPVTKSLRWYCDVAIVAPVCRILAPGVAVPDAAGREQRCGPRHAVGAPPQPFEAENAARRCAVALPFVRQNAAATQCYRERRKTRNQKPARNTWRGAYMKGPQRSAHEVFRE
jgi:hypothetical protein